MMSCELNGNGIVNAVPIVNVCGEASASNEVERRGARGSKLPGQTFPRIGDERLTGCGAELPQGRVRHTAQIRSQGLRSSSPTALPAGGRPERGGFC